MAMRSVLTKATRLCLRLRSPTGHVLSPPPPAGSRLLSTNPPLPSTAAGEEQVVYSKEEWECHQLRASFAAECKKFREMRHQQEAANVEAFREFAEQHKKGMEKHNRIHKAADAVIVGSAMLVIVSLITMI